MPRARSPNRDKAYEMWKKSKGNKKNKEIAAELGVSESQISQWKKEDDWEGKTTKKFTNRKSKTNRKEKSSKKNEESIKNKIVKSVNENEELTEKQRLFCLYYIDNRNATQAYLKAHQCSYLSARVEGHRNLTKPSIKREIELLKKIIREGMTLDGLDIVERMMRIGCANITDFMTFKDGTVTLNPSETVDGCLIAEVKQTKSGVSIKLEDRMKALAWLGDYFELNPMNKHRKEYDEKVLALREKENKSKEWM